MHDGTITRPEGASIRDGQRVLARGHVASNGDLRADVVNVAARAFGGYRNGFDGYGRRSPAPSARSVNAGKKKGRGTSRAAPEWVFD